MMAPPDLSVLYVIVITYTRRGAPPHPPDRARGGGSFLSGACVRVPIVVRRIPVIEGRLQVGGRLRGTRRVPPRACCNTHNKIYNTHNNVYNTHNNTHTS